MLHVLSQGIFRWLEFFLLAVVIGCSLWITLCAASFGPVGTMPHT